MAYRICPDGDHNRDIAVSCSHKRPVIGSLSESYKDIGLILFDKFLEILDPQEKFCYSIFLFIAFTQSHMDSRNSLVKLKLIFVVPLCGYIDLDPFLGELVCQV